MKELIPYGCRKPIYYSNEYEKSYKCNLLGLSDKFNVDENLYAIGVQESQGFVLLDINEITLEAASDESGGNGNGSSKSSIGKCTPTIKTNLKLAANNLLVPSILVKMEEYILDDELEPKTMKALMDMTKTMWLK